jgi:NAD(P)-dependent dehydrogenase (short-subunit alcohol dehydrogenase family)
MRKKPRNLGLGLCACVALTGWVALRKRRDRLKGQVVLITGGSRGLGLALARKFADRQCRLALCARDAAELERARVDLTASGAEVLAVPCDVSDVEAVGALIETVRLHYGRIDIVVNNAGEIQVAPLENLTTGDFERAMAVMFWGAVHTTLAALPVMRDQNNVGRIVNITSIGGKISVPHLLPYSCAKAAAAAFSEGLRNETRHLGIRVTTVVPGLMRTGSHVNALFRGKQEEESRWFGVAASLPLLTISAESAASQVVRAVCRDRGETVLGLPAILVAKANGLFPNVVSDILAAANRILPDGSKITSTQRPGIDLEPEHGEICRLLTTLGRRAGQRLNQPIS